MMQRVYINMQKSRGWAYSRMASTYKCREERGNHQSVLAADETYAVCLREDNVAIGSYRIDSTSSVAHKSS